MAQLKDLIVSGTARILNKIYATEFVGKLTGNADTATTATDADKLDGHHASAFATASHTHTKSQITDFPTSLPASDVYSWAKASSKPSYTKSEVGLGNVDNTADANKSVKYATSAGSAPANGGTATSSNYVNVNNTEAKNVGRLQYFQKSGDDTIMPSKDWYSLIRCQHPGYANGYWQDIAFPFVGGGRPQVRQNVNGTKSAWKELAYKSDVPSSLPANGGNSATVNGHTVNSDVPANAKFTDTNTWRPLGTTANTACAGNDSRLSNARPASDVYAWAKASSKPSYSWSEITSKPSTFTPSSHTHDDRYYTESEINSKLSGKANSSHGNHVPATQTANNAVFLRNDNTWQKVTPANIGALSLDSNVIHSKMYYSETKSTVKIHISCTATTTTYAGSGTRQLRGLLRISWGSLSSNDSGCSILRTVDFSNTWRWINCSSLSAPSGTVNYSSTATKNGISFTTISFSLTKLNTPYVFIEYDNSISNLTITAS